MQAKPANFLAVIKQLKRQKLQIATSHRLQRMPRGFEALGTSPLAEFLRLQSFVIMRPITDSEALSPNLPRYIARFAIHALPLLAYGWSLPEAKPAAFLD
jgi:uncharacterized protein (DUF2461 family)